MPNDILTSALKGAGKLYCLCWYGQDAKCSVKTIIFFFSLIFDSAINSHAVAEGSVDFEELEDDFTTFYVAGMSDRMRYNTRCYRSLLLNEQYFLFKVKRPLLMFCRLP